MADNDMEITVNDTKVITNQNNKPDGLLNTGKEGHKDFPLVTESNVASLHNKNVVFINNQHSPTTGVDGYHFKPNGKSKVWLYTPLKEMMYDQTGKSVFTYAEMTAAFLDNATIWTTGSQPTNDVPGPKRVRNTDNEEAGGDSGAVVNPPPQQVSKPFGPNTVSGVSRPLNAAAANVKDTGNSSMSRMTSRVPISFGGGGVARPADSAGTSIGAGLAAQFTTQLKVSEKPIPTTVGQAFGLNKYCSMIAEDSKLGMMDAADKPFLANYTGDKNARPLQRTYSKKAAGKIVVKNDADIFNELFIEFVKQSLSLVTNGTVPDMDVILERIGKFVGNPGARGTSPESRVAMASEYFLSFVTDAMDKKAPCATRDLLFEPYLEFEDGTGMSMLNSGWADLFVGDDFKNYMINNVSRAKKYC